MAVAEHNEIEVVDTSVEALETRLRQINQTIWENPELAWEEHKAHDLICDFLEEQGFDVTRHAYGLKTSFEARFGSGGRLINFNAEYDALPDIGHACGHNLIATSSITAFLSLTSLLKKYRIPGRVQLLGTPAEENGGGKAKLIDAGAYQGVDISLMAHGGTKNLIPGAASDGAAGVLMNARKKLVCDFTGKNAHAGGNPWEGVNALDALVLSYNNVSVLRQQILPDERIHGAFVDSPKVANIIPAYTKCVWQARSPTLNGLDKLVSRVRRCLEAAALATGCEVQIVEDELYADIKLNETLCDRYQVHMAQYKRDVAKKLDKVLAASSDIGNVSYVVPTLHTVFGIPAPEGSFPHHPSFAAAAATDDAHREAIVAGKSLALVGWDMLTKENLYEAAKTQWESEIADKSGSIRSTLSTSQEAGIFKQRLSSSSPLSFEGLYSFSPRLIFPLNSPRERICANSLVLADNDQEYFQYFPSSSPIFFFMKGWDWSCFNYIYKTPAATSKIIMRMILAIAATDKSRHHDRDGQEDKGRSYYGLAVREFRDLLTHVDPNISRSDVQMIFAIMFLMIIYESLFGHSVSHLQMHLHGVVTLLKAHPEIFRMQHEIVDLEEEESFDLGHPDDENKKFHFPILAQLLIWILYIEINCQPMGLKSCLFPFLYEFQNPYFYPDYLHQCARIWARCFWGSRYPDHEILDDIENHRGLELIHHSHIIRQQIWNLAIGNNKNIGGTRISPETLSAEIRAIGEVRFICFSKTKGPWKKSYTDTNDSNQRYSDLLITVKFAGATSARRTLDTIYFAACLFYGLIIYHRRLLHPNSSPTSMHRQATSRILKILHKQHSVDPRLLLRVHWPIFIVAIETDDPIHREWLQGRLEYFSPLRAECSWENAVLGKVLAFQRAHKGQQANLLEILRSCYTDATTGVRPRRKVPSWDQAELPAYGGYVDGDAGRASLRNLDEPTPPDSLPRLDPSKTEFPFTKWVIMAEAIAAFSLAANIVQFIDFGVRVTSNFWSFYKAASTTDDDAPDVETINSDLQNVLKELQSFPEPATKTGLAQLAQECQKAAAQLEKILQPMITVKKRHEEDEKRQKEDEKRQKEKDRDFGKREKGFRKRAALKAAFKLSWKEDEIQSLKGRVDQFRSQLILHILASLRDLAHKSISYQREILDVVNSISHDSQNAESIDSGFAIPFLNFVTSKLDETRQGDTRLQLQQEIRAVIRDSSSESIRTSLSPSMDESRQAILEKRVLASLYYTDMKDREGRISEAYGSTFRWIFNDSPHNERKWDNFKDWLQSDSQLYWITGKPGSGKSTLMKFVCEKNTRATDSPTENQSRCVEFLQPWARGEQLVIASFYFWNSSIAEQRKQSGLFRTLLFQLLEHEPQLIPAVAPKRWETLHLFNIDSLDWSEDELGQMLRETASQITKTSRMCLFVDGLDEFDGNHAVLIDLFKDLITNSQIKLCVASRPWVEFEDAFKHGASLMPEHLTYQDMKEYVSLHMEEKEGFKFLHQREPAYAAQLVENIISKSSGVFLWVRLVVASILGGMAYGDRISDLQKRLDALPPELEELYDKMLSSLDPFYLEHAAQLFKFVQVSLSPPYLLTLACADEDDSFLSVLKRDMQPFSINQVRVLHETMRRRINSRCKGLLEVSSVDDHWITKLRLNFEMNAYDAHLRHCIGILSVIKGRRKHSPSFFQSQMSEFLQYAKGVKQEGHAQLRDLMEEFDNTCTAISQQYSTHNVFPFRSNNVGWACVNSAHNPNVPFNCHFLSISTRCGIKSYVMGSVLEQGCVVPAENIPGKPKYHCVYQDERYPLLLDAVTWLPTWHWLPSTAPDLEMIAFLLNHGADPNMLVTDSSAKPFTIWHAALAIPPYDFTISGDEEWRKWLEVYKILLEHGAGHFLGTARLKAQKNIDMLLSRALFSVTNWEILIHQLRESKELPDIYSTARGSAQLETSIWDELHSSQWDQSFNPLPSFRLHLQNPQPIERNLALNFDNPPPLTSSKRSISPSDKEIKVVRRRT
ncbi:hypothetical protein B7463_g8821, partial [Scytalidium lignicola]